MSSERDALADAALRFSEAIRTERDGSHGALAGEREIALQLIKLLRNESQSRAQQTSGRFLWGLLLGAALGAGAAYMVHQRTSEELRLGLTGGPPPTGPALNQRIRAALEAGRQAALTREQELWDEYRRRLAEGSSPRPRPDDPFMA